MHSRSFLIHDPHLQLSILPHPDSFGIDSATGYGIEQVRKLNQWIQQKPFSRYFKLLLIKKAEELSPAAQNALLKTLEEPPPNNLIILTTRNQHQILSTVQSRCAFFHSDEIIRQLILLGIADIEKWLLVQSSDQGVGEYPIVHSAQAAFEQSDRLSKLPRPELIDYLQAWAGQLMQIDPEKNFQAADQLFQAAEYLSQNTHPHLTLDVHFLKMLK